MTIVEIVFAFYFRFLIKAYQMGEKYNNFHVKTRKHPFLKITEFSDAQQFASTQKIKYFETSAKDGLGVEEMFTEITRQALAQKLNQPEPGGRGQGQAGQVKLNEAQKSKKSCCK